MVWVGLSHDDAFISVLKHDSEGWGLVSYDDEDGLFYLFNIEAGGLSLLRRGLIIKRNFLRRLFVSMGVSPTLGKKAIS